jgi:hypothetical protein
MPRYFFHLRFGQRVVRDEEGIEERAPGVTDLPIDRIAQVVQPTPAQRTALDELEDASVKAAQRLRI